MGLPQWLSGKESAFSAGATGDGTELDVWDPLEFCWAGALYLKKKLTRVIICERWNDLCKQHLGYFF